MAILIVYNVELIIKAESAAKINNWLCCRSIFTLTWLSFVHHWGGSHTLSQKPRYIVGSGLEQGLCGNLLMLFLKVTCDCLSTFCKKSGSLAQWILQGL